jgi:uncharacterized membrane protein YsdA (DUF1294 family)/cold shock CspA family protein
MSDEAGELAEWNDERGFGFIETAGGERLFVHIKAFGHIARRPLAGDRVRFARGAGRDSRPVAVRAAITGLKAASALEEVSDRIESAQFARALRLAVAAILLLMIVAAQSLGDAPPWLIVVYLVVGLVSAATYWLDKRAAQTGAWRIAETTLHSIDLLGGIIGGLLAQVILHHKTAKASFATVTAIIVVVHAGLLMMVFLGIVPLPQPF